MSALVVPCARFLATMQNGPVAVGAVPRMEMLDILLEGREDESMLNCEELGVDLSVERGPRGAFRFDVLRDEEGLLRSCRSCVQSAFTFPADGRGEERAEEVERYFRGVSFTSFVCTLVMAGFYTFWIPTLLASEPPRTGLLFAPGALDRRFPAPPEPLLPKICWASVWFFFFSRAGE